MAIKRQVVLECVQPSKNHNKFYEISVRKEGDNHIGYYVECRWGRIENFENGSPQSQIKGKGLNWDEAMAEVGTIMFSKLKKGYKVVKDTASGHKAIEHTSKTKQVKIPEPTFDRTEHQEIALNWWSSPLEAIEERVV